MSIALLFLRSSEFKKICCLDDATKSLLLFYPIAGRPSFPVQFILQLQAPKKAGNRNLSNMGCHITGSIGCLLLNTKLKCLKSLYCKPGMDFFL